MALNGGEGGYVFKNGVSKSNFFTKFNKLYCLRTVGFLQMGIKGYKEGVL